MAEERCPRTTAHAHTLYWVNIFMGPLKYYMRQGCSRTKPSPPCTIIIICRALLSVRCACPEQTHTHTPIMWAASHVCVCVRGYVCVFALVSSMHVREVGFYAACFYVPPWPLNGLSSMHVMCVCESGGVACTTVSVACKPVSSVGSNIAHTHMHMRHKVLMYVTNKMEINFVTNYRAQSECVWSRRERAHILDPNIPMSEAHLMARN